MRMSQNSQRRQQFVHTARLRWRSEYSSDGKTARWLCVVCGARTTGQKPCCVFPLGGLLSEGHIEEHMEMFRKFGQAVARIPGDDGQFHSFINPDLVKAATPDTQPSGGRRRRFPEIVIGPWWKVNLSGELELTEPARRHAAKLRAEGRSLADFEHTDPPKYRRRASDKYQNPPPPRPTMPPVFRADENGQTTVHRADPERVAALMSMLGISPPPRRSIGPVTNPHHLLNLILAPGFICPTHGLNRVDANVILEERLDLLDEASRCLLETISPIALT